MSNFEDTDFQLKIKSAYNNGTGFTAITRSNVLSTAVSNSGVQGEPHYTTDTKQLFIHDGTVVQPVQSLDMAVGNNNEVVCNNNEIVYNF